MTFKEQLRKKLNQDIATARLASKWMPRQGKTAFWLRGLVGLSPKQWRKTLVNLSNTVEQKMCAKEWNDINFAHVPSVAAARYNSAFLKNAPEAYTAYKESLVKGDAKINASAIFPHDVVRGVLYGSGVDADVVDAQWKSLPNYMEGNEGNILVLSDVSGSMSSANASGKITAMDISIALGLYISERLEGPFKDMVLTFSDNSKFHTVRGKSIASRIQNLSQADWGGTTNFQSSFNAILKVAKENEVAAEDMPKYLVVLSDMEFDQAEHSYEHNAKTNFQAAKEKFEQAGYEFPKIVFWNLANRGSNVPVRYNEQGVALVSGFSPSIMKSILSSKEMTPQSIMLNTVMVARYDVPSVTVPVELMGS